MVGRKQGIKAMRRFSKFSTLDLVKADERLEDIIKNINWCLTRIEDLPLWRVSKNLENFIEELNDLRQEISEEIKIAAGVK